KNVYTYSLDQEEKKHIDFISGGKKNNSLNIERGKFASVFSPPPHQEHNPHNDLQNVAPISVVPSSRMVDDNSYPISHQHTVPALSTGSNYLNQNSEPLRLANLFAENVKRLRGIQTSQTELEKWARVVEQAVNNNGYTYQQIETAINFAFSGEKGWDGKFCWADNVRSMEFLIRMLKEEKLYKGFITEDLDCTDIQTTKYNWR
ncbi:hypothetical protein ACFL5V_13720, partial [Fibrobacterota bacterium]